MPKRIPDKDSPAIATPGARAPALISTREAHVPRRSSRRARLLGGVLLLVTVASLVFAYCVVAGWRQASGQLRFAEGERLRRDEERIREFDRLYRELRRSSAHHDGSYDGIAVQALRNAQDALTRLVQERGTDTRLADLVADAHFRLGHIARALRQPGRAEAEFDAVRRMLTPDGMPRPDAEKWMLRGASSSRLSCLLASMGRWRAAHGAGQDAVECLSRIDLRQADWHVHSEAVIAHRNLALILAAGGDDGTATLRRAIQINQGMWELLRGPTAPDQVAYASALLADSYQILSGLYWQAGEWDFAEDACLQAIHALQRYLAHLDYVAAQAGPLGAVNFKRALCLAERNLAALRQCRAAEPASCPGPPDSGAASPFPGDWWWVPLQRGHGDLVDHELLTPFRLRAEFEHQEALLLCWQEEEWCQDAVVRIAQSVADQIQFVFLVESSRLETQARHRLQAAGVSASQLRFVHVPTDSFWIRDFGPLAVETAGGRCKLIDACYRGRRHMADGAPAAISELFQNPLVSIPIDIEWGALLTNGAGLCLVSSDVLRRNLEHGFTESDFTSLLRHLTGARSIVYLEPLSGEPTGHLDVFATFVSPNQIVVGDFGEQDPGNDELLDRHASLLSNVPTPSGHLEVVRIPMPPRQGTRDFTGSFTNVVFTNGTLLVPTSPEIPPGLAKEALAVYERLLPGWKVVGIDSQAMWIANGGPRCATMNLFRLSATGDTCESFETPDSQGNVVGESGRYDPPRSALVCQTIGLAGFSRRGIDPLDRVLASR